MIRRVPVSRGVDRAVRAGRQQRGASGPEPIRAASSGGALLDADGCVVAVNEAWATFPAMRTMVGVGLGVEWAVQDLNL